MLCMIGLQRRSDRVLIEIVLLKQIPITATFEMLGAMITKNRSNQMACVNVSCGLTG